MAKKCYAVDLDGTLAKYDGWNGFKTIGDPIPLMLNRVKMWIKQGIRVVIFTARASNPKYIPAIEQWLESNGLPKLKITNVKTPDITRIYDDRAVQVKRNTGELMGNENIIGENLTSEKLQDIYLNK
jgi:hypothetical protein